MTWLKVDDSFESHPKVRAIPRRQRLAAVGLWTLAGSWCARHLTDGHISALMIEELGGTSTTVRALVEARLWVETAPGLYAFHDWSEWQPTREKVESDRAAAAERQRRARERAAQARASRRDSDEVTETRHGDVTRDDSVTHGEVLAQSRSPRPDPTRPDPTRPDVPSEHLGGGGARPADRPGPPPARNTRPPRTCPQHTGALDDPPCRACADARRAADAWQPPTPVPSRPTCPRHPGQPLPPACPDCAREKATPPPGWRALAVPTDNPSTEEEPPW